MHVECRTTGRLWAQSWHSGNTHRLTRPKKQKTPTAALALEILLLVLRERGCGELGRARSKGGRREALPWGGHAVWGLLAGSLARPASSGWVHGTWHPASPLPAWHGGLLSGGRPPFPVVGIVSLSQCGGVGVRGGHLPGVQAGPVRQSILGSRRLRRGEAHSGSSSPTGELGSPGGALAASAGHHPDKLCEGTGPGGEKTAESGPAQAAPSRSSRDLSPPPHHHCPAGPLQPFGFFQSILCTAAGGGLSSLPGPSETSQGSPWEIVQYPVADLKALHAVAPADVSLSHSSFPPANTPPLPRAPTTLISLSGQLAHSLSLCLSACLQPVSSLSFSF